MEYWHHISFSSEDNVKSHIDSLKIRYKLAPLYKSYILSFDITESDPRWLQIEEIVNAVQAVDLTETIFLDKEIRAAKWSRLIPRYESGYPQPESMWSYSRDNYSSRCPVCGAGFVQIAPFRIRKEPGMKRTDFMSLYWTYALFGIQRVYDLFEQEGILGYEAGHVLLNKSSLPSSVIQQLCVDGITSQGMLDSEYLDPKTCSNCMKTKYKYHKRGYMRYRNDALPGDKDIVMTYEWFGDGGMAFREFLVSNKLAQLILDHKLKGVALKPITIE